MRSSEMAYNEQDDQKERGNGHATLIERLEQNKRTYIFFGILNSILNLIEQWLENSDLITLRWELGIAPDIEQVGIQPGLYIYISQ